MESVVAVRSSENQTQQRARPSGSPVEQPGRMGKKCCYSQKSWGSICCSLCSVSNSPLTHNPFVTLSNKVRGMYFSIEVCPLVFIVLSMFLHAYEYVTYKLFTHRLYMYIHLTVCKQISEVKLLRIRCKI